jgi:hypothetical protein
MAAITKKPSLPPLQTPQTASFPSEIVETPLSALPPAIKVEHGLKTPITPPVAYTEFLKALTPILTSPRQTPALPRSLSSESAPGRETPISGQSASSSFSFSRQDIHKATSASAPPPTPFVRSNSASRTPTSLRRLTIPQSPAGSPRSAVTLSTAGLTSAMARSPFSPADWNLDSNGRRYFEQPRSATVRPVSVRSVVTRTVIYKRTPPLDPAPKGKKRKLDVSDMPPPSAVSPAAPTAVA